jgi:hypothetical protein
MARFLISGSVATGPPSRAAAEPARENKVEILTAGSSTKIYIQLYENHKLSLSKTGAQESLGE